MNAVHPERRCSPRFSTAVEIQVESRSATTVNFSTFGVYLETALPFAPEQEILIVFPFHHTVPGIYQKTNVSRRAELVRFAQEYGLG